RKPGEVRHGWLFRLGESIFDGILHVYVKSLIWVLGHQRFTLLVTLSTVGFTIYLYIIIPKGFFPQQDTGRVTGNILADQDTSFQAMEQYLNRFVKEVSLDPAVTGVTAFTGGNNGGAANTARMFVTLLPVKDRKISSDQVIARIRAKAAKIPGAALTLQAS